MSLRSGLLLLALTASLGCQSLGPARSLTQSDYPKSGGRENPADDRSDPWVHEAGTIARTEHVSEEVRDPLGLRNVFMSEKAREIERNVGIGR